MVKTAGDGCDYADRTDGLCMRSLPDSYVLS